ncbi:hypothetical protein ACC719_36230, partial [Rhizobium ruizarguesonis]
FVGFLARLQVGLRKRQALLKEANVGASQTVSGQKGELRTQFDTRKTSAGDVQLSWLLDLFGLYKRNTESELASLDSAYAS